MEIHHMQGTSTVLCLVAVFTRLSTPIPLSPRSRHSETAGLSKCGRIRVTAGTDARVESCALGTSTVSKNHTFDKI